MWSLLFNPPVSSSDQWWPLRSFVNPSSLAGQSSLTTCAATPQSFIRQLCCHMSGVTRLSTARSMHAPATGQGLVNTSLDHSRSPPQLVRGMGHFTWSLMLTTGFEGHMSSQNWPLSTHSPASCPVKKSTLYILFYSLSPIIHQHKSVTLQITNTARVIYH